MATLKRNQVERIVKNARADGEVPNLQAADLRGVNLVGANFSQANLSGANLSGANLTMTNLSESNLSGANLSEANLEAANLSKANLCTTDLSGVNLSKTNLTSASYNSATKWPEGFDFTGVKVRRLKKPLLCRVSIHKWGSWTDVAHTCEQKSVCLRCGAESIREAPRVEASIMNWDWIVFNNWDSIVFNGMIIGGLLGGSGGAFIWLMLFPAAA